MLRDNINNALKDAMKARDERRVSTLRHDERRDQERRHRGAAGRARSRSTRPT